MQLTQISKNFFLLDMDDMTSHKEISDILKNKDIESIIPHSTPTGIRYIIKIYTTYGEKYSPESLQTIRQYSDTVATTSNLADFGDLTATSIRQGQTW